MQFCIHSKHKPDREWTDMQSNEVKAPALHEYNENEIYRHPNGNLECKLCLTYHPNLNSFLAHAQGKLHRSKADHTGPIDEKQQPFLKYKKIGIPKYDLVKIRDPESNKLGFRVEFQLQNESLEEYPDPEFKILNSYEQSIEAVNPKYQYLVVAAPPYETVSLRIPSSPLKKQNITAFYDPKTSIYQIQLIYEDITSI